MVSYRIIADHIRTSVFLIADGAQPDNKDQGYITRRLIRRALRRSQLIGLSSEHCVEVFNMFQHKYALIYPNVTDENHRLIFSQEIEKFLKTLDKGLSEFIKLTDTANTRDNIAVQEFGAFNATSHVNEISGLEAFLLYSTYGFPLEMIMEEAEERGLHVDTKEFEKLLKEHQEQSRSSSAGKFKGGLAGDSPKITAFHTATHLMLEGLRKTLGEHVHQAGSNITDERTRFDFTHPEKISKEDLATVEQYVNDAIASGAHVVIEEMSKSQAQEEGVEGSFWERYPETVQVYSIKDEKGVVYSRELCGGPHVHSAKEIQSFGTFVIKKESSSSAGVRRIKAIFEK
jgi:alanyl-tRNA synthetase